MTDKSAVFFCSASNRIDPKYTQAAREVVRAACLAGYGIVSGGSFRGTMGAVADTAAECGVPNKGVLPRFMRGLEHKALTELVWTESMSTRKEEMRRGTCLAVALPGGIGTMDELFETVVLAKLGRWSGKIIAYNFEGYFEPLKALLRHFEAEKMMGEEEVALVHFPETPEEFKALL